MKWTLFTFLLACISFNCFGKSSYGEWLGTFTKKPINERYSFWSETQLRYSYTQGGMSQVLVRMGALDQVVKDHELGYLYGYIHTGGAKEHRLTLQHSMKYSDSLSHRMRFEGRYLEDVAEDSTRFRYLIRYQSNDIYNKFNLVLWDEVFVNTKKVSWNGGESYDRNRLFVGLNKVIQKTKYEFGFLNQHTENVSEYLFVLYLFF